MCSRKNYTEKEKCTLLEIVEKYKNIVENKATNAVTVAKKNEAWETIMGEYNARAEVPRSSKQLLTAYLNLKRLTRKAVADENIRKYIEEKARASGNKENVFSECINDELKMLKKDQVADKKGVSGTGGGCYTPRLTDAGAQVLAIIGDQIQPLSNKYDSATEYCTISMNEVEVLHVEEIPPTEPQKPQPLQRKAKSQLQQKKKQNSNIILKRQYYKKKLECALVEKRTKLKDYHIAMKKEKLVDLELKIKEVEYSNLVQRT